MKLLALNSDKISPEEIMRYYNNALSALELKFKQQPESHLYLRDAEMDEQFASARTELSIEAGFMLLAYVESLFREDFIKRIENRKWKDPLTTHFRRTYNVATKPYQYRLADIFSAWRNESGLCDKAMDDIMAMLPQYFMYRHWIAHGRYWILNREDYIQRYKFDAIRILVDEIHRHFNDKFKKSGRVGERMRSGA